MVCESRTWVLGMVTGTVCNDCVGERLIVYKKGETMDELKKVMDELSQAYTLLQGLNIQPTKSNMGILLTVMDAIQTAYQYLGNMPVNSDELRTDAADSAREEETDGTGNDN